VLFVIAKVVVAVEVIAKGQTLKPVVKRGVGVPNKEEKLGKNCQEP
jgi:hypothetical protein